MAELKLVVPMESVVVDALSDLAQQIMDSYGIQLHSAEIQWENQSLVGQPIFKVIGVNANISMVKRETPS